mgnify:CR=1 FL=1
MQSFGSFARGGFDYNNTATTECNTVDYPLYDPDYYDQECEQYYWCFRYYDYATCEPQSVSGYTQEEAEWIMLGSVYSVAYMNWFWVGFRAIPYTTCL